MTESDFAHFLNTNDMGRDPRVREAFESAMKRKSSGVPLSDAETALFFVEATQGDYRYYFFDAPFEAAAAPERAERVLLISLSNMGDVIGASAVMNGLRAKYPSARIVFLTETPGGVLYTNCPDIDRVIEYSRAGIEKEFKENPTLEGLQAACGLFVKLLAELRAEDFDVVFNLHASVRSALIAGALGVPPAARIGFSVDSAGNPVVRGNIWMHTRLLAKIPAVRAPEEISIRALGLAPPERKVGVCIPDGDGPWVWIPFRERAWLCRRIGVNPFASQPVREWGEDKFGRLCRILSEETDCELIVFAGPAPREREGAERLCGSIGKRAVACAGAPPDKAAWAARQCELFITNDTGPMHFAGATGARCLVIHGPSNILPYSALGHIAVSAGLPCTGCAYKPKCDDHKCMKLIEPEHLARIAEEMLSRGPHGALSNLAGHPNDGKFPLCLLTTGTYESLTPRYVIRLRSLLPAESSMVSELTRIAAMNTLVHIEGGSLETGNHPLGLDHPGLAAPVAPETAVREVLKRHDFLEYDPARTVEIIDEVLDLYNSPINSLPPEKNLLLLPFTTMNDFLRAAGLSKPGERAGRSCRDFLSEARKFVS